MMNFFFSIRWAIFLFLPIALSGCTTLYVPQYGTGTVTVVEGGLVETIQFAEGATLNIQITREYAPEYEYLLPNVLTIGRFSPVIGSGFTGRSNIYYEAEIGPQGQDIFEVEEVRYRVFWQEIDFLPGPDHYTSVFTVSIEQTDY